MHQPQVTTTALRYVPLGAVFATLAATPALILVNQSRADQLVVLVSGLSLMIMSFGCPPDDLRHGARILGRMKFAAIAPLVWIAIQLLPLPFLHLGHSSWQSASAALGVALPAHITVDVGSTFDVLIFLIMIAIIVFVTTVAAKERRSAELILIALSIVTVLVAIASLLQAFRLRPETAGFAQAFSCIASLGAFVNLAGFMRIVERTGRQTIYGAATALPMETAGCVAGVVVCAAAVIVTGSAPAIFSMLLGLGFIFLTLSVQRRNLTVWSALSICAAVVLLLTIAAGIIGATPTDLLRLLGIDRGGDNVIQRMLSDSDWFGFGAGAFQRMVLLYHSATNAGVEKPPTTIALLILEWGWFGTIIAAISAMQILAVLVRGVIGRRRDTYFPALGAAAVIGLFLNAFFDAGLLNLAAASIAAVVISLGASQSVSQR